MRKELLVVLWLLAESAASAQTRKIPTIQTIEPRSACAACATDIAGRDIGGDPASWPPRVLFVAGPLRLPARVFSGGQSLDDPSQQTLTIETPPDAPPGEYDVVVETAEGRSVPFRFTVSDSVAPFINAIVDTYASPGERLTVAGGDFGTAIEFQFADANGRKYRVRGSTDHGGAAVTIPDELPEGQVTVSVRNPDSRMPEFSTPLPITIVRRPPPPHVFGELMAPVAPGQWTDLRFDGLPLTGSQQTNVEFAQGAAVYLVNTLLPTTRHVRVPPQLRPGPVQLRVRTWARGVASEWSSATTYSVAATPALPIIGKIAFKRGDQIGEVELPSDPQSPAHILATRSTEFVLIGFFPVAGAAEVQVRLQMDTNAVPLMTTDEIFFDDVAIKVRLPRTVPFGAGVFVVRVGSVEGYLPVVVKIEARRPTR